MLNLMEELTLLVIQDEKGTLNLPENDEFLYALTGALLLELYFRKRITFADGVIQVISAKPTGDRLLDDGLEKIVALEKDKKARYWVKNLADKVVRRSDELMDDLVEKGYLVKKKKGYRWSVKPAEKSLEHDLRARIRNAVLLGSKVNARMASLLTLTRACGLTKDLFRNAERKTARQMIRRVVSGEQVSAKVSATAKNLIGSIHDAVKAIT